MRHYPAQLPHRGLQGLGDGAGDLVQPRLLVIRGVAATWGGVSSADYSLGADKNQENVRLNCQHSIRSSLINVSFLMDAQHSLHYCTTFSSASSEKSVTASPVVPLGCGHRGRLLRDLLLATDAATRVRARDTREEGGGEAAPRTRLDVDLGVGGDGAGAGVRQLLGCGPAPAAALEAGQRAHRVHVLQHGLAAGPLGRLLGHGDSAPGTGGWAAAILISASAGL